ncbi:hypothetical protein DCPSUM001_17450 [Dysgonomonas capnocytophagoides]|nr:hypothetical protein DCPSUM001_17450 [Dysgonomonas capnocytophagoides]
MKIKTKKTFNPKDLSSYSFKSFIFFACFFLMSISAVYAQTKTISGKVIDELNDPLTGVTVRVQGTTTGTITDIDGMYSISTKDGDIIEYSFIGMKTELIAVKGQTSINITLKDGVPFWEKPLLSVMAVPKLKTSHRLLQLLPEMR